ncbi:MULTISPECIES: hypothetical protein [Mycobacterium avium complex (MAC)]|uniref:hypothetical protein n=1 Tax=Mycobacterium avium complex (MAC) TaxID=120793 RepID=UPI000B3563ED|nr:MULTISPECIES: hypothetical protein [Mycobacterium avium complex (MAC)]UCN12707.1 hypothetical protein LFT50_29900 [Mycobacterium intracellulare subsp. chimaera]
MGKQPESSDDTSGKKLDGFVTRARSEIAAALSISPEDMVASYVIGDSGEPEPSAFVLNVNCSASHPAARLQAVMWGADGWWYRPRPATLAWHPTKLGWERSPREVGEWLAQLLGVR